MKTAISIIAAMMLCIPAFAESAGEASGNDSKEKKNVTYNENGEIIKITS